MPALIEYILPISNNLMNRKFCILALTLLLLLCFKAESQSQEKVYSVMMMNFAKGTQWPAANSKGNFVIGVVEYPPLAAELLKISANLKLGNRKIEIREFEMLDKIGQCHMLFLPAYKARRLPDVIARLHNDPILLITNKLDYAKKVQE
jgi:hypothetical protein